MRPHVELIDEKDLIWHIAELPHGSGQARQRNLNYCEEKGEASLVVEFVTDWQRPSGFHAAQTEWYVLEGEVRIGDETLDYLLDNVLDPNAVIGKDYQLNIFELKDGRVASGVVNEDSPSAVRIAMPGGVEQTITTSEITVSTIE